MDMRDAATEQITRSSEKLIGLSKRIHSNPEIGFEEENACQWLSAELADAGFSVELGICELPTAFIARRGHGPLHVAICAEYDSLPGIGHACGHNIIAASAIGAGIAVRARLLRCTRAWRIQRRARGHDGPPRSLGRCHAQYHRSVNV